MLCWWDKKMPDFLRMNGTQLKIFAALIMVADHIGAVILRRQFWLRIIGRMAFPIFCFCMAEGLMRTRNIKKYMLRLLIAGIITEPVFNLAFSGSIRYHSQNVMFTFLLAAMAVWVVQRFGIKGKWKTVGQALAFFAAAVLARKLGTDYGAYGVLLVGIFYLVPGKTQKLVLSGLYQLAAAGGVQMYSVFSLIPLAMYDGQRGRRLKYFFYIFYPGHLLVLYLVARCMGIYG